MSRELPTYQHLPAPYGVRRNLPISLSRTHTLNQVILGPNLTKSTLGAWVCSARACALRERRAKPCAPAQER